MSLGTNSIEILNPFYCGYNETMNIRKEVPQDYLEVYDLVKAAFEHMAEASGDEQDIVNRLRKSDAFVPELSLVAEMDGRVVGHIMFTKMKIGSHEALTLAPVSVLPQFHGQGIGSALILEGHRIARDMGFKSIVVIGHAYYYPRFGYKKAHLYGLTAPFEVPPDAFMVIELVDEGLKGVSGMIELAPEFFIKE